jgi:hypothetical protein
MNTPGRYSNSGAVIFHLGGLLVELFKWLGLIAVLLASEVSTGYGAKNEKTRYLCIFLLRKAQYLSDIDQRKFFIFISPQAKNKRR